MEKSTLMIDAEKLLEDMGWKANYNHEEYTHAERGWTIQKRTNDSWAAFNESGKTTLGIEDSLGAAIKLLMQLDKKKGESLEKLRGILRRIRSLKEIYALGLKKATEHVEELNTPDI